MSVIGLKILDHEFFLWYNPIWFVISYRHWCNYGKLPQNYGKSFFTIIFTIIVRNNSFESLIFLQKSDELFVDYGEEKVRQARWIPDLWQIWRMYAPVAQWIEQWFPEPCVGGSSPFRCAFNIIVSPEFGKGAKVNGVYLF